LKLLTIAIPTYNRSACLAECLEQIVKQLPGHEDDIEIIVSDNCSTDDTPDVVARYIGRSSVIRSIRNSNNIGADNNFIQCFELSESVFFMLMGDDDVLLDGGMDYLLGILKQEQCSSIFLRASAFIKDFRKEIVSSDPNRTYTIYNDPQEFIKKININATFISSNIINKLDFPADVDLRRFYGTNLVQLGWIIPSIINAKRCIYVDRAVLAGRVFNSGNFRFFQVFAVNFNKVIEYFSHNGMASSTCDYLIHHLLTEFYPQRIYTIRTKQETYDDEGESIFDILQATYRNSLLFWIFVVPAIFLPVSFVKIFYKCEKKVYKRYNKIAKLFKWS